MNKIQLKLCKSLKISNVLIYSLLNDKDTLMNIETQIEQVNSYIRIKGASPLGPLIQYTHYSLNDLNEPEIDFKLMLQCNTFIHHVDPPYKMESIIHVPNCMYCRYTGPEDKLKFAYDKIMLTAFEEDIPLKGDSYTIFVDRQDDYIIADVFMERADNE